jgi:hypothetical protein
MPKEQVIKTLEKAVKGLIYLSESDAPFEVVYWPGNKKPLTPESISKLSGSKPGAPVAVISVKDFFEPLTEAEDWHEAEEKALVKKYQGLQETLRQQLTNLQIFKVGQVNVDVYLVGLTAEGDIAGVKTKAVET